MRRSGGKRGPSNSGASYRNKSGVVRGNTQQSTPNSNESDNNPSQSPRVQTLQTSKINDLNQKIISEKVTDLNIDPTIKSETEDPSLYIGSFQGPSYCHLPIPNTHNRKSIAQRKISKLESYLNLCEMFYFGNISDKSPSDFVQSLLIAHNMDSSTPPNNSSEDFSIANSSSKGHGKQLCKNPSSNSSNLSNINQTNAENIITPMDLLTHPLRAKCTIDLWGPKEVALFECGVCKYGKEFDKIQRIIKTKTTKEIVDFYYQVWKRTSRYKAWKENRQLSNYIMS
ncbi:MYB-like DNA-binding domain-containing protein [Cryptosporidium andersoni]|uniref:MYB-like DNA-binding domain-containing protein n=1 Tax=Cryptosporidium andersoni TaxID=117008 RepID=A0A1J4ME53_9CRYT|nr:MYB-like DNA-binding domain-containing protein [Cryptosporidium andersoni]